MIPYRKKKKSFYSEWENKKDRSPEIEDRKFGAGDGNHI